MKTDIHPLIQVQETNKDLAKMNIPTGIIFVNKDFMNLNLITQEFILFHLLCDEIDIFKRDGIAFSKTLDRHTDISSLTVFKHCCTALMVQGVYDRVRRTGKLIDKLELIIKNKTQ